MATVTLGLRSSGSYGSSHQHQLLQNGVPAMARKQMKMMKERDKLLYWIFKRFAPRRRFAMLLLSIVSVLIFVLVPFVDKGEDAYERVRLNNRFSRPGFLPINQAQNNDYVPYSELSAMRWRDLAQPRPSPVYFKGYTLPPGNPCKNFKLPPPPSDKKRTGPRPCPVCYLPVEEAIASMPNASSFSPVIQNLTYIHEENSVKSEFGGSDFGGYPSLKQRNDSYDIRESMSIHCGFVRGVKPGHGTGFEIDDSDRLEMETCKGVVVASAIFGVYDILQQPTNISEYAKKNACFYMFVDEETDEFLRNNTVFDSSKRIELWRIVVVHNLPYTDPRRNGKVPKLLLHRLFPNARYSLWIDGKLQLVVDPYQILERFLWRENASFAISRHYKRFDTFIEAEANKAAGKYDNSSIDFQIQFYKNEGLTPYSTAKLPITSDVPEGCVIIREHIPISNLFTCQWFHEVDRFTSRDQISFSTVRDKITAKTNWNVHMFLDCERRNFVVQGYHRDVLEHWAPPSPPPPPPPEISSQNINNPPRKIPAKHWRDGTSGLHPHRKVAAGNRHTS